MGIVHIGGLTRSHASPRTIPHLYVLVQSVRAATPRGNPSARSQPNTDPCQRVDSDAPIHIKRFLLIYVKKLWGCVFGADKPMPGSTGGRVSDGAARALLLQQLEKGWSGSRTRVICVLPALAYATP
jgi:hypothetical protein